MAKDTLFSTKKTLNASGSLLDLTTPIVMGILNTTPDSFFDGGKYSNEKLVLDRAEKILREGAAIIDIGGYSSRPGAKHVTFEEETRRVVSGVKVIRKEFPEAVISVDTFRASVAEAALNEGAHIINDISGGNLDEAMFPLVVKTRAPYIMMHMKGTPLTMRQFTTYDDLIADMINYFLTKVEVLKAQGVPDVIIDPGFGFSKTKEHNFEILQKLSYFKVLGLPLLAGMSRKSMIYKTLDCQPEQALNGTTVLNTLALMNGVQILRVHDVKEAMECIQLFKTTYA